MNSAEFRAAIDALPFGKRLPGAVYLPEPGDDGRTLSLLRRPVSETSILFRFLTADTSPRPCHPP
jgi:hypothetical protein